MTENDRIYFVYDPKGSNHVKDSLYHMMKGDSLNHAFEIDRGKLSEAGFVSALDSLHAASFTPCSLALHHLPSGSTVVVEDDRHKPNVKIIGHGCKVASDALAQLVRPYGFELKEVPVRSVSQLSPSE